MSSSLWFLRPNHKVWSSAGKTCEVCAELSGYSSGPNVLSGSSVRTSAHTKSRALPADSLCTVPGGASFSLDDSVAVSLLQGFLAQLTYTGHRPPRPHRGQATWFSAFLRETAICPRVYGEVTQAPGLGSKSSDS